MPNPRPNISVFEDQIKFCATNQSVPDILGKIEAYYCNKDGEKYDVDYTILQRPYVWEEDLQCAFIESLIIGIPIPPIVLIKDIKFKTNQLYHVLDGQQRLKTLYRFFKNEIPYTYKVKNKTGLYKKYHYWYNKIPKSYRDNDKHEIINDDYKAELKTRILPFQIYDYFDNRSQSEMFVRIQLSSALNHDHLIHSLMNIVDEDTIIIFEDIRKLFYNNKTIFRYDKFKCSAKKKCNKNEKDDNDTYFYHVIYLIFRMLYIDNTNNQKRPVNRIGKPGQAPYRSDYYNMLKDIDFIKFIKKEYNNIYTKLKGLIKRCKKYKYFYTSENNIVTSIYRYYYKDKNEDEDCRWDNSDVINVGIINLSEEIIKDCIERLENNKSNYKNYSKELNIIYRELTQQTEKTGRIVKHELFDTPRLTLNNINLRNKHITEVEEYLYNELELE